MKLIVCKYMKNYIHGCIHGCFISLLFVKTIIININLRFTTFQMNLSNNIDNKIKFCVT